METSKRAKSYVLLNETERGWLRGHNKNFTSKDKSVLHSKLDKKFEEMLEDLKLIADSKNLQTWREMSFYQGKKFWELEKLFKKFTNSVINPRRIFIDKFRSVISGNKIKYWLEPKTWDQLEDDLKNKKLKTKKLYYNEKIFRPEFMLRELKARKETKKLIMKLWEKGSLPQNPKNAITLEQIKKKLKS